MKKIRILSPIVYYVAFFFINIFNSYILTSGLLHYNLSPYNPISGNFLSFLGDFGVLLMIFMAVVIIFKKHRGKCNALLVITLILTLFILFLTAFSNMFSMFFAFSQLTSFKNPAQGSLILEYTIYILNMFKEPNMYVHVILAFIFIALRFFINTDYERAFLKTPKKLIFFASSFFLMLVPLIILNVTAKGTIHEVSMSGLYGSSKAGTYNYYFYAASETVFSLNEKPATKKEKENIEKFLESYLTDESITNAYTNTAKNKNLVVLQLEAFNNFVIGLTVDGVEITPNLNRLINESYYNNRFYSTAGIGNTSDCEFSVFTGLYPNGNDLAVFSFDGKNYPTIARDFSNAGYETFSIHGNDGAFYNRQVQHIETYHFDEHYDKKKLVQRMESRNETPEIFGDWLSDDCLLQESIHLFDEYNEHHQPFFAYDILVTSHTPFIKNNKIEKLKLKGLTELASSCLDYYHYVDQAVGHFFEVLKTKDYYENTMVVIYGDHTSSILRRDIQSITNKKYNDVEYQLTMQNVPLIIHCPTIFSPSVLDSHVRGQVDIYPTMVNLFGLKSQYTFGNDIFGEGDSLIYSPRTLDLIYDDYVILTASNKVYYLQNNKISKKKKENLIQKFYHYKYYNDMLMRINYFQ